MRHRVCISLVVKPLFSAMKLHLPARLFRTLIAWHMILSFCSGALSFAEVSAPLFLSEEGYVNGAVTYSDRQTGAHTWTDYEEITFRNCYASSGTSESSANGGAVSIYNDSTTLLLNNNGAIDFCDNHAGDYYSTDTSSYGIGGTYSYFYDYKHNSRGGAVYNTGDFQVNCNESVHFQNNTTYNTSSKSYQRSDFKQGTYYDYNYIYRYIYRYYGGAIYNTGTFSLTDNGEVLFQGNASSESGGAIYNAGTFSLTGNGDVVFRQNWEGGNSRLRSIYNAGGTVSLDALDGHRITFYDGIYSSGTLNLNETGTGDIVFTGATTEEDLLLMKGSEGTVSEIRDSRTSELYGTSSLGGGRLVIRDEARLLTFGNITLGEGASICLHNGEFGAGSGYTQTFGTGTTLNIEEAGTIYNDVSLQSGSTLQMDKAQATFSASLSIEEGTTLVLNGYQKGETYTLLMAESLNANPDNIRISGNRGTVSVIGNSLVLESDCERLQWSGSGYWSEDSSKMWTSAETEEQMSFASGDEVVFNNGGTVNISGEVHPSAIEVSGTRTVTFRGDGSIIGYGQLTKEGSCTLTVNTANCYGGGTVINGGTVKVGHAEALGTGEVSLGNGATLDMAGHAIANELRLVGNGVVKNGAAFEGALVLESGTLSGDALQIAQQATVESGTIQNALTGIGSLLKTTEGTVLLNGDNSYSGGTVVEAGALALGHLNALGSGAVELAGGTLDLNRLEGTFRNSITGTGSLILDTQHLLSLAGDSSYSGGTVLKNGTVTLLHDHALGTGVVELAGGTLDLNAQDIALDNALTGIGSLVVDCERAVTLNGNNSYSGGTTLNKGTLTAGSATAFGTAAVTVNGGTLDVNGLAAANAVVLNGGTLQGAEALTGAITVTGNAALDTELNTSLLLESGTLSGTAIGNKSRVTAVGGELACDLVGRAALKVTGDTVFSGHATHTGGTTVESGSLTVTGAIDTDISVMGGALVVDTMVLADGQAVSLEGGNISGKMVLGDNTYLSVWEDAVIDGNVTVRDGVLENYDRDLRITGTLALESGYTEIGGSLHAGTLSIAEGAELVHGSEGQISVTAAADAAAVLSGVSMEENILHGSSATERGRVEDALIEIAEDVDFSLQHLVLSATTRITDDPATLQLDDVAAELTADVNTTLMGETVLSPGVTLVQNDNAAVTLTLSADAKVALVEATTFDTVTLSGESLVLNFSGFDVVLFGPSEFIGLSFTGGGDYATFDSGLSITMTLDGEHYAKAYRVQDGSDTVVYFNSREAGATPEPAATTLSLLALTALAARRKRK